MQSASRNSPVPASASDSWSSMQGMAGATFTASATDDDVSCGGQGPSRDEVFRRGASIHVIP